MGDPRLTIYSSRSSTLHESFTKNEKQLKNRNDVAMEMVMVWGYVCCCFLISGFHIMRTVDYNMKMSFHFDKEAVPRKSN